MSNRYELWKKYGLNLPVRHELSPSRRYFGLHNGSYDDFPLLKEAPWYQDPKCRTPEELLQRAAGWRVPRTVSIHGPEPSPH
ncbi:MAG: hypothetical protein HYU75_17910 [Betaproteobacteria bacterium]|nr:hypothetical protein [Betaproteobacteria bacterium]